MDYARRHQSFRVTFCDTDCLAFRMSGHALSLPVLCDYVEISL